MKKFKLNKKNHFLTLLMLVLVFMLFFVSFAVKRMENYMMSSGEENMTAVIEQMEQAYDLRVSNIYERLGRIERNLFQDENRSVVLEECQYFLSVMTDDPSGHILFIKENGQVMTAEGIESYLDIQSSSLLKLKKKERIAQSVSWNVNSKKESIYLVALPCEEYYVDGNEFSAIGFLFNRSGIDSLFEVSGYSGHALLFSVDENGIVTYTNQVGDKYYRNYSLLKHMKQDGYITEYQYEKLNKEIKNFGKGVEICSDGQYYLGFRPLRSNSSELICIVPSTALNNSLLSYQGIAVRMIVVGMLIFAALTMILFFLSSKMSQALDKAKYEEETRKIKEEAMAALKIERDRADYANQAKSQFLSNMSHDIRTPMNAIVGFTSLAIAHIDDDKTILKDYLEKISVSSEHLLSLINDVLDMSRIESGKIQIQETECSLPALAHGLRSILQSAVNSKNLEFHIDTVDVQHEKIFCDKLRVNQILLNIASNAVKYTNPGGTVSIKFTEIPGAPEKYADFTFSVTDTGIGMSEDFIKTIFEPFTREKNSTVSRIEGTGLGMAITKNIVDMMGGTVSVTSRPGAGSEFVVKLRFRTVDDGEMDTIPELDGFRALVADDNMDSCGSVAKMLRSAGLRPEWTTSGKEVIFRTRMSIEENDPFRVYIIDWMMPDMNGIEVVRRVRSEIGDDIPIIILTAYDWHNIEKEAREAGVTAFCSKPLFKSELYNALKNAEDYSAQNTEEYEAPEHFKGKRVLVVDDVELNREIAAAVIEDAGMTVELAENGREAVDMISASDEGWYDIVLMDIMMPVMDGYEAAIRIRRLENRKLADIPIIAMTANAFEEDRMAALKAGMDDHLSKPIEIDRLYDMMVKYLK
ncbi:MAG: response regulator [Bacillota bacterium]|nr:response regulator [Bacillota bacterium]